MANAKGSASLAAATGQENVNPARRQKLAKTTTQGFTFECKSDSSDKMALVRPPPPPPPPPPVLPQAPMNPAPARGKTTVPPPPPPKPKPRKKDVLDRQARHRKKRQEIENFHNPPSLGKPEDQWVCYMCEYEEWFGEPPKLFTRKYEEKDFQRRKAKRIALKKLEQAKAKSRKGKKNKSGTKGTNSGNTNPVQTQPPYDPANEYPPQDDGSQGDEYYDEEYDDTLPAPTPLDPHDSYANGQGHSPYLHHSSHNDGFPGLERAQSLPPNL